MFLKYLAKTSAYASFECCTRMYSNKMRLSISRINLFKTFNKTYLYVNSDKNSSWKCVNYMYAWNRKKCKKSNIRKRVQTIKITCLLIWMPKKTNHSPCIVKFRYSEKVTNIWKNLPLCFDVTKCFQNMVGYFF